MSPTLKVCFKYFVLVAMMLSPVAVQSEPSSIENREVERLVNQLASLDQTIRLSTLEQLVVFPLPQALPALLALKSGTLYVTIDKSAVIVQQQGHVTDALTGQLLEPTKSVALKHIQIDNRSRRLLKTAIPLAEMGLATGDKRLEVAKSLQVGLQEEGVPYVRQLATFESNLHVREALLIALAPFDLKTGKSERQMEIIRALMKQGNTSQVTFLQEVLNRVPRIDHEQEDLQLKVLAEEALSLIGRRKFIAEQFSNLLYGISLGSILLLTSLGLAITLGQMGIINMAHGEFLMLGAYSTFLVQNFFHLYLPNYFHWYLLASLPIAFIIPAIIGIIMERLVLRYLSGRPLETLLATWGISLILIQAVRLTFGASNVEVVNPTWLSGSIELSGALLPLNRIFCIAFCSLVCLVTWFIFQKTRFGLEVRAISQNRSMAAAGGVSTEMVDTLTFAFGSGIAGLAGLVLTQLGNVGPELGQGYIVDSFLVVVFGGVGKIVGTIYASFSLGIVNKFLEPILGAVLAKIIMLFLIVLFIQKRPQGLSSIQLREVEV